MITYVFKCDECAHRVEMDFPMDAVEERQKAPCPTCGTAMRQTFDTVQIRTRVGWREFTHYDLLPPEVKGAGPASKEFRDHAETHQSATNGRWI